MAEGEEEIPVTEPVENGHVEDVPIENGEENPVENGDEINGSEVAEAESPNKSVRLIGNASHCNLYHNMFSWCSLLTVEIS